MKLFVSTLLISISFSAFAAKPVPLPLNNSLQEYKAILNAIEEQGGIRGYKIKSIQLTDSKGKVEFLNDKQKCSFLPMEVSFPSDSMAPKATFTTNNMSPCK